VIEMELRAEFVGSRGGNVIRRDTQWWNGLQEGPDSLFPRATRLHNDLHSRDINYHEQRALYPTSSYPIDEA